MIILNKFDEFGHGMGFPSMREYFQNDKYENQDLITAYLKTGTPVMVQTAYARDVFTGTLLGYEKIFVNDGVYAWSNDLAYYVEKYNLKLPDDFTEYVLNKQKNKKHFAN